MKVSIEPTESQAGELHLCLIESGASRADWISWERAGIASLVLHIAALSGWASLPQSWLQPRVSPYEVAFSKKDSVPLIAPRFEMTQHEVNKGPITRELDIQQLQANMKAPAPAAMASRPRLFTPPPSSGAPAPLPSPTAMAEPPKVEAQLKAPQGAPLGNDVQIQAAPPPETPPVTNPKMALGAQGSPLGSPGQTGRIPARVPPPPKGTVDDAVQQSIRHTGGGIVVGDSEDFGSAPSAPSSPGAQPKNSSSVELLSDPQGVDFRPYLIRVLASVRRNWFAVIPESARMGLRGRVLVQFSIDRQGRVPKLVISTPSGAQALDRAAVAGISASNPFPPLPPEFHGDHIRLQLAFSYNMAR